MSYRSGDHTNSPSMQYEDAPEEPPHLSELVESPADRPSYLHTDGEDVLELQPSPPQTPQHAQHETTLSDDTVGEGSLSVDVDDSGLHKDDGMHSVAQSPVAVSMPVAAPAVSTIPVAVPHQLPVAAPAPPPAQPVAAAVLPPPSPPPPPVDPVVAERAAKRAAFFKAQAQRSQQLAAELDQMGKQNEREESFWSAQEHRCAALLQRSEMADRTSKELVRFFEMTNRAVSRTLVEMAQPAPLGSVETGSLKEACAATEHIRHVVVNELTELRDKQMQHCLSHATTLSRVMAERVQAANTVVTTASRDLKREREQLKANWAAYDKAVQERVKSEFSEHSIRIDPLLPLRSLLPPPSSHHAPTSSQPAPPSTPVLQNQYRTHLSALFLDLKTEEERRIEQSKAFLLQVLMSMNTVIERIHARVREGIVAVTSIDAVDDLHHFIESNDLALAESEMEAFRPTRKASVPATEPARKLSAQPPAVAGDGVASMTQTASESATTEASTSSTSVSAAGESGNGTSEPSVSNTAMPAADQPPTATDTSAAQPLAPTPAPTAATPTPAAVSTPPALTTAPSTAITAPTTLAPPPATASQPALLLPTPTVFSLQPPTRDPSLLHRMYTLEVEREGVLHRPSRFLKKWKEQWVVVSKSGWLHCWDDRSEAQPTVSMPLVDVVAQLEKGGGGGIEIVSVAHAGGGSGGYGQGGGGGKKEAGGVVAQVFRADNPMEAARWIEAINKYCHPA